MLATIWRGGCIIRARFLNRIKEAYDAEPDLANLLLNDYFRDAVAGAQDAWREVVRTAVDLGVPTPAFSSALAYYDGFRRERGPGLADPGPARPLRRPHLPAHRPRRLLPHPVVRGRQRGQRRLTTA